MPPGGAHAAEAGDERPENTGSGEGQGGGVGKAPQNEVAQRSLFPLSYLVRKHDARIVKSFACAPVVTL